MPQLAIAVSVPLPQNVAPWYMFTFTGACAAIHCERS